MAVVSAAFAGGAGEPPEPETRVYKTVAGRELALRVDKPSDWRAGDRRPAIVFFFGGGYVSGTPEQFRAQSRYLASRGMVGIRADYRLLAKGDRGPPLVCLRDGRSAVRWVRAHAAELGVDPERIAAAGGSAGGHLAAATGLIDGLDDPADDLSVSAKPQALVLFNPVLNIGPGQTGHERVGERYREFSPAHHVSGAAPPAIVFLGTADDLIPVAAVEEFKADMLRAGVRCEALYYEGARHGFFNQEPARTRTLLEVDRFLASLGWLEGAPTLEKR